MTGLTGSAELHLQQEERLPAVKDETSLSEAFKSSLEISQDVEPSEETDSRDGPEQEDRQRDRQRDRQQWAVGARCQAVWSEDGRVYPATVVSVDGKRCRVRFSGYNNEEDVDVSALRRPDAALQTHRHTSQDWKPGSPCRAVYSEDGLFYPAVVLWVKGQRCRVRFDKYNNEEELDVSTLLDPNELHGPPRRAAAPEVKEKPDYQSKTETEEKKRDAEKPANHSSPLFPPFPPPPQFGSGHPVPFIPPPPPPLWTFGGKESGSVSATSSMLMLWYMCGFHTGSYLAQQEFRASSKQ